VYAINNKIYLQGNVEVNNATIRDSFARAILYFNAPKIDVVNTTFIR
jgi:hypothetical protein